jgi:uncharacterized protein YxeA
LILILYKIYIIFFLYYKRISIKHIYEINEEEQDFVRAKKKYKKMDECTQKMRENDRYYKKMCEEAEKNNLEETPF